MSIGPVEIIVVGFPNNQFTGEIAPALAELVEAGTIRVIDLVFVTKKGVIKRTPLTEFARPRTTGLRALSIREDDALVTVLHADGRASG